MSGNKNNPYFNNSGCADPTAYNAMKAVEHEESELDKKVHFLIKVLKFIISESGFELMGRIEIKDRISGREFR